MCRRLQEEIEYLKKSKSRELETQNLSRDCCSETDTEGDDCLSNGRPNVSCSPNVSKSSSARSKSLAGVEELNDDVPLISLLQSSKHSPKKKTARAENLNTSSNLIEASANCLSKTTSCNQQTVVGRKRVRVVLSDDEDEMHDEVDCSKGRLNRCLVEDIATSDECAF